MSQRYRPAAYLLWTSLPSTGESRKQYDTAVKATLVWMGGIVNDEIGKGLPGGPRSKFEGWKSRGVMRRMLKVGKPVRKPGYFRIDAGFVRKNRYRTKALYAHNYGATIRPKKASHLVFKGRDGRWYKMRSVRLRKKSFFDLGVSLGGKRAQKGMQSFFLRARGPVT